MTKHYTGLPLLFSLRIRRAVPGVRREGWQHLFEQDGGVYCAVECNTLTQILDHTTGVPASMSGRSGGLLTGNFSTECS